MHLSQIFEAVSDIKRDATKATIILKSHDSAAYTNLAKKVERLAQLEEEVKSLKNQVKEDTKVYVADLFEAEDEARTRVVDTVSFILTLSKNPAPTESYKYAKIIEELSVHLTPELMQILISLKEQYKTVIQKSPSLKITDKNPSFESINESFASNFMSYIKKFNIFVHKWGRSYDQKLARLKGML